MSHSEQYLLLLEETESTPGCINTSKYYLKPLLKSFESLPHFCIISTLLPCPRHAGYAARLPTAGPPLPQLPPHHLSGLLCHLRPDGPVRAGQRGRGRPHEAPGGQQQGGAAGGDGGEGGEGGEEGERGGQQTAQHGVRGRRAGAELGRTCAGNVERWARF